MTKNYILKTLNEFKPILQRKYKIKKIGIFGSYSINKQNKSSDIDIFVEFKEKNFENIVGLWNFLENKFNKKIDLIYQHKNSNLNIIENIKKRVIYG